MQPSFAKKLVLSIWKNNVGTQKIDGNRFKTFKMIIASILVYKKDAKSQLFKETFLLADMSMNVTFKMCFFTLSNLY